MRIALGLFVTFLWLTLNVANAEVDYVSLNEIESAERQPLFLRINLVEKGRSLPLRFTLASEGVETEMAYHRLNDFMVRLASQRHVQGQATVYIYQFDGKEWARVASVDVSNDLKPRNNVQQAPTQIAASPATDHHAQSQKDNPEKKDTAVQQINDDCMLSRTPKETLWSIASRYKAQWKTDVFSAMLAIFQSNPTKFNNGHINQLIDGVQLVCPQRKTLEMMGDKEAMRTEFFRLKALKP